MQSEGADSSEFFWPKVGALRPGRSYWYQQESEVAQESAPDVTANEYEQGYAEGLEQGREAGRAEFEQVLETLRSGLLEMQRVQKDQVRGVLGEAAEVLQTMFTALFQAEFRTNPAVLERLRDAACRSLDETDVNAVLTVAHEDFQKLSPDVVTSLGDSLRSGSIREGTVRVTVGRLVKEIDFLGNFSQIIAAGLNESQVE